MRPHVICLMIASLDGSLAPSHWTTGPGNSRAAWSDAYARLHGRFGGDAWLVGRVTMAEMMADAVASPVAAGVPERPHHFADRTAASYAIGLDPSGRLCPGGPLVDGDHAVLLLGAGVTDAHLSALIAAGVSYIVSSAGEVDLPEALTVLERELGIKRLLLEGGGGINGSFLDAGLVDEISVIIAPALDGRAGKRTIVEAGAVGLAGKLGLELAACEPLEGGMVHLRYTVRPLAQDHLQTTGATGP